MATANKKFGLVRAMINRSIKAGTIEKNPFDGVQIDVIKKKAPRIPFDNDDIKKLFVTLSNESDSIKIIAKLALTTGARLAELVQLRCNDVLPDGDLTFITIRNDDDEHGSRSTKNPNSVRRVPLRSEIALILKKHIEGREGLVFPELESKTAGASNIASKKVMRWIRMSGVTDKRKTFHSFRHYFIDLCREHGIPEEVRNALTGHAGGDHVGRKYGNGVPLRAMADSIDKLEFPAALR